jgi:hypothetical protein
MDVLLVCWDTKPVITPGGRLGLNRYEVLLGLARARVLQRQRGLPAMTELDGVHGKEKVYGSIP